MIGDLRGAAVRGGAMLALCGAFTVHAQEPLPDRRSADPPVISGAPVISPAATSPAAATAPAKPRSAAQESLLDVIQQLDYLQNEVRQLRDALDIQTHELNQLKARNRDLTEDLDRRLRALEQPPAAGASNAAADAAPNKSVTPELQKEYDAAFDLMKQGSYERSIKAFREFNAKHAGNGLADNAQYWIAEGTYVQRHYKQALDEFNKLVNGFPHSQKLPDALLKIGYTHYELGAYDKARKSLNEVLTKFPGTPAAKLAAARLDKMKKEGR